ncbi:DEAD/DEAH box helicase [Caulobacter sp. AP07]|uniref:DEAD/DEAH box helicase n=1 Tax=Caulobacter sp. AP07 TaxID=1144304 RepID=UPI0003062BAB|nr:DEAD/DEAH box helicase [Caulobacter sp. AP07]
MTQFTDLALAKPLLKALTDKGYTTPTPIQAQAIPLVMSGRDLLGIAQTGTGKTAAFALPILHRLAEDKKPAPRRGFRCLVLSPTRELATQIADSFRDYGKHMGLTVATIFGGVKYGPQMKALAAGVDVVVATPGRLMDHLGEKSAHLNGVEIFVLDEADQMLDLGFVVPIRKIASQLPKERQNLFFSATMPSEIGKLAGELLKNPAQVAITPSATTVERIDQSLIFIEAQRKRPLLAELLADKSVERSIVFTRTKRGADRVAKYLVASGIEAAAIHGDKTQGQRERALAAFKAGQVKALIATDIAARGIDVNDVSHVFNFELPNVPESYVHRIGRTARKGKEGVAISFCADDERNLLRDIQKATRQTIPTFDRRNDKTLAAAAAVADKLAPPEKYVDPRRADPRNNVPAELRKQRNRGGRPNGGAGGAGANGGGNGQAKPGGQNRGRNGGGQGQAQAKPAGGEFRGPKRANGAADQRWNPID